MLHVQFYSEAKSFLNSRRGRNVFSKFKIQKLTYEQAKRISEATPGATGKGT